MKITIVNYMNGEARFVFEEFPKRTFCVSLKDKTTKKQVVDKLKSMMPSPDASEKKFNDLKLKDLEGTDA